MLECYCRQDIWNICRRQTGKPPEQVLVRLKGDFEPVIPSWEYEGFYKGGMSSFEYIWVQKYERKRGRNDTFRYAVGIFSRNGDLLFKAFVKERFDGDLRTAILQSENFDALFDKFEEWFKERK